jgi:predicted AAA+ superfamily ATPase
MKFGKLKIINCKLQFILFLSLNVFDILDYSTSEKIYIQVSLRITEKQTMEREFENLMAVKDNYPKYVITLDEYEGTSYEGIIHFPLRKFLFDFM